MFGNLAALSKLDPILSYPLLLKSCHSESCIKNCLQFYSATLSHHVDPCHSTLQAYKTIPKIRQTSFGLHNAADGQPLIL